MIKDKVFSAVQLIQWKTKLHLYQLLNFHGLARMTEDHAPKDFRPSLQLLKNCQFIRQQYPQPYLEVNGAPVSPTKRPQQF